MKMKMTMTSSLPLRSGKCWLQLRVEQHRAQAHGDRANVLADADTEGTSEQGSSQGYGHGHPPLVQIVEDGGDYDLTLSFPRRWKVELCRREDRGDHDPIPFHP